MSAATAHLKADLRYVTADGEEISTTLGAVDEGRLSTALPMRKFYAHARQRHYSGLFWSATTGDHVPYESRLEMDRLWFADFDPTLSWISAQPMRLSGNDGEASRRHVPDFLLTHTDGTLTVVDVKPREFARHPKAAAVFAWTQALCSTRGWSYEIWHGGDPIVLANIKFSAIARRRYPNAPLRHESPPSPGGTTVESLHDALQAVWSGEHPVELDVPLNRSSLVR